MSDYRRIVSYIYRYENGEKRTNEGYVRLEIRNGQLKVTIHITSQAVREAQIPVYFYRRRGDSISGIALGEFVLRGGEGDFKGLAEAGNIMGSGAALEHTGGMILAYVPDLFFATEWDDRPVTKEDMLGVIGGGQEAGEEAVNSDEESVNSDEMGVPELEPERAAAPEYEPERSSVSIGESESERFLSEQELEAEESFLSEREAEAEEKITAERESEYEEKLAAEQEPEYEEKFAGEREPEEEEKFKAEQEPEEEKKFVAEQEPGHEEKLTAEWESEAEALTDGTCGCASAQKKEAIEYYTYGQYGKLEPVSSVQPAAAAPVPERAQAAASQPTPERVQPAAAAPTPPPVQAAFADSAPKPVQAAAPNTASEPARNTVPPSMVRAASVQEASARKAAVPDNRESVLCSADEKPLARTILDQFPKMTPFQDSEISECVRIVPQNIGLLPMDAWVLGNNSFLQHGYYNHQHLIFAKKFTRSGIMYLLGVPGYFTQRERNMARMFGFHNFKSVKMRPVQNGEFGYWYVPIVF